MAATRALVTLIATALTRVAAAEPEREEREALAGDPLPPEAAPAPSFDEQLARSGYTAIRYGVFRGDIDWMPDRHDALALGNRSLRLAREVGHRLHALAVHDQASWTFPQLFNRFLALVRT
jgi:hypothetical protein